MATFEELAQKLDELYTIGYCDREKTMREFGTHNEPDLRRITESGRGLDEIVGAANIGESYYWAGYIREGMGIAIHLRETGS